MINISFTGHRPNKIYGYNIYSKQYEPLRDKLLEVFSYVEDKYGEILNAYNGLALGFDTIAFEELYFSKRNTNIIGCIPFEKQASKWNKESVEIYNIMKSKCDEIVYVDTVDQYKVKNTIEGEYNVVKMMKRNELMIDNSNILISCWNHEKKGGTWSAIRYALQHDNIVEIININPNTLEIEILKDGV